MKRSMRSSRTEPGHGERNSRSVFLNADVIEIRRRAAAGDRMMDIAAAFRCSEAAVRHIVKRRRWGHLP